MRFVPAEVEAVQPDASIEYNAFKLDPILQVQSYFQRLHPFADVVILADKSYGAVRFSGMLNPGPPHVVIRNIYTRFDEIGARYLAGHVRLQIPPDPLRILWAEKGAVHIEITVSGPLCCGFRTILRLYAAV